MNQQKIIIVTAPSGSGKTTLVKRLLAAHPLLAFSVSACTRAARANEQHGVDYYFMSSQDFKKKIDEGAFVEWEMVYEGKYYGTLVSELERIWKEGKFPLVDIDVQGALAIQEKYSGQCLSVFIEPPSLEALRERLQKRGTETEQSLHERVNKAAHELLYASRFNKVIINDDLETAADELVRTVRDFIQ